MTVIHRRVYNVKNTRQVPNDTEVLLKKGKYDTHGDHSEEESALVCSQTTTASVIVDTI